VHTGAPFHNSGFPIRACGQNVVDVRSWFTDAGLRDTVLFFVWGRLSPAARQTEPILPSLTGARTS